MITEVSDSEKRLINQIKRIHPMYGYSEIKEIYQKCQSFDSTIEVLEGAKLFKLSPNEALQLIRVTNSIQ